MIESKILGSAVGIQRGDVIDRSETTVLPSLANGVIAGCFKRGRMDKPFKVTGKNYKALLGYDPSNPNYLAVEDAFKRGVSEISILRVGGHESGGGDGGAPSQCTPTELEVFFNIRDGDLNPVGAVHARYRINGEAWIDYSDPNDTGDYSVVNTFFSSLYHNDWQMINVGGGGGRAAFCTPYQRAGLYGASSQEPYNYDQDGVISPTPYTIEFAVTESSSNDLVFLAFGKDVTIKSCAIGNWMGY